MKLTISSGDPVDQVVAAVQAVLGVELTVTERPEPSGLDADDDADITRPRPT